MGSRWPFALLSSSLGLAKRSIVKHCRQKRRWEGEEKLAWMKRRIIYDGHIMIRSWSACRWRRLRGPRPYKFFPFFLFPLSFCSDFFSLLFYLMWSYFRTDGPSTAQEQVSIIISIVKCTWKLDDGRKRVTGTALRLSHPHPSPVVDLWCNNNRHPNSWLVTDCRPKPFVRYILFIVPWYWISIYHRTVQIPRW